jgi:hypothetical protein
VMGVTFPRKRRFPASDHALFSATSPARFHFADSETWQLYIVSLHPLLTDFRPPLEYCLRMFEIPALNCLCYENSGNVLQHISAILITAFDTCVRGLHRRSSPRSHLKGA